MSKHSKATQYHPVRHYQLLKEHEHDTYKARLKLPEPTVCPDCGAVYHAGRWTWAARPEQAHEERCSACHRIHDRFPAGHVHVAGDFLKEHKDEIVQLIRNRGKQEGDEHPLERIMAVEEADGGLYVTTTGIHLARRIGEALHDAYRGDLQFHYNDEEKLLRVNWKR